MWTCPKCKTQVEAEFEVCWQCGTAVDGTEDPDFDPELDGIMDEKAFEAERAARVQGKVVTVRTFLDSIEAHLFQSRLEAAGIPAMVLDERGTALYSGLLGLGSTIKVVVHEADLERALDHARQVVAEDRGRPEKAARDKDAESIQRPPDSVRDGGGGLLSEGP